MIVTTLRLDPLGLPDKLLDFAGHTRIARMTGALTPSHQVSLLAGPRTSNLSPNAGAGLIAMDTHGRGLCCASLRPVSRWASCSAQTQLVLASPRPSG